MQTITITMPSKTHALRFMQWLDNQGEQDYFQACEDVEVAAIDVFHYNYDHFTIRGELLPKEEKDTDNEEV